MPYSTQSDLELFFGARNIAAWSNLDRSTAAADTDRIAEAIAQADAEIDSRFRNSRFAVPLTGDDVSTIVKGWSARLAGAWLYDARPMSEAEDEGASSRVDKHKANAHAEMSAVLSGARKPSLGASSSRGATGPTFVTSE